MVRALAVIAALTVVTLATPAAAAPNKVAQLVAQLTLDEKLSLVHGGTDPHGIAESGYIPGVPRLGIPELRMADGSSGIRTNIPSTTLPAPVSLASSFDPGLARDYGTVLGRDGRTENLNVLLGPTTGIIRTPYGGRDFESYSEDPLVSAETVAQDVRGIQSQGLIATVKHFAENNQETDRDGINVHVGEQALHQIELPAFQSAVDAGAGAIMCSYNQVNGQQMCGNGDLLDGVLRAQWGFAGWVMSDWDATHATDAITKGVDQEMPDGTYFGDPLKKAIQNGTIPMSALNTAVTRILTVMNRFHLLDKNPPAAPKPNQAADDRTATQVAEQGAVLLKNKANVLPLNGKSSVAVIGPTAQTPKVSGGGSGKGNPTHAAAPIDTIRARAGGAVTYSPGGDLFGQPIPATAFDPPLPIAPDGTVSLPLYTGYQGSITVPTDGDYRISVSTTGIADLFVDNQDIIGGDGAGLGPGELPIHLTAGKHDFAVVPVLGANPSKVKLGWVTPEESESLIPAAVAAAKQASTAVVFAYDDETEGTDRSSIALAQYQNDLITQVAKANPHTVVVLNTGSAVAMPWLNDVASVLDMWYPGQDGAEATTALLFGDAAPGGRLTQTFPTGDNATPLSGKPAQFPGVDGQVDFSEGIEVGYRWYEANNVQPLFPFGFGLTYTSFAYHGLAAYPTVDGGIDVLAAVTNTGKRTGQAVPQIYLGPSPAVSEPQAVRALAGYTKLSLQPGETRIATIHVDASQLNYWNTTTNGWTRGTGQRTVWLGSSSTDLAWHQLVTLN